MNSFFAGISSTPFMPSAAKSVRRSHRNYGNTESSSSPSPYCDTPNKVMATPTSIFDCYYMYIVLQLFYILCDHVLEEIFVPKYI